MGNFTYLRLSFNVTFVIASILYVILSIMGMNSYRYPYEEGNPSNVSSDVGTWNDDSNETDTIADNPSYYNVSNYGDNDESWTVWHTKTRHIVDDYDDHNNTFVITNDMVVYFFAAVGFFITGILEVLVNWDDYWGRILYMVLIVAAVFGIISSTLVLHDPHLSAVMNFVSIHLFALEAVSVLFHHQRQQQQMMEHDHGTVLLWCVSYRDGSDYYDFLADVCLVIGTVGDVILSYVYVLDLGTLSYAYGAVIAACFWLLSSSLSLGVTLYDGWYYQWHHSADDGNTDGDNNNVIVGTMTKDASNPINVNGIEPNNNHQTDDSDQDA